MPRSARFGLPARWLLVPLVLAVPLSGCLEDPLPDGVYACDPDDSSTCPDGWVCRPVTCPADYRCFRYHDGDRRHYPGECVDDGVCDRDACESCLRCPSDCCPVCDEAALTARPHLDFLVSAYVVPTSSTEAKDMGVDLDGDGTIDDKLGSIVSLFGYPEEQEDYDANAELAKTLAAGQMLLVLRVFPDGDGPDNDQMLVQVLEGRVYDATPLFDGSDRVALAPDADPENALCGARQDWRYESNPSRARFPLPLDLSRGGFLWMTMDRLLVSGGVDAAGWPDITVGGGLSRDALEQEFFPWWADLLNARIAADPEGGSATWGLEWFENNCEETIDGCDPLPDGCAEDGVISVDEIRCNALLDSALHPDVDLFDEDPSNDLMSVGVRLSAVPVTVVE